MYSKLTEIIAFYSSTCWIQGLQTECYSGKELIAKEFLHRQRTNLVSGYIKTSTLDALYVWTFV